MTTESGEPSIPDETTEAESARQLAEEKFEYFRSVVHAVRFEPPRDVAELRKHNANVRARTAARVAIGARMPIVVKPRRR